MSLNSLFEKLDDSLLQHVSGGAYDPSGDNREPGQLYFRKEVIDQSKTPEELISQYPELAGFKSTLKLFGFYNVTLSTMISKYGLNTVQGLIDSYTP